MKKILSLLLLTIIVFTMVISCSDTSGGGNSSDETGGNADIVTEETTTEKVPALSTVAPVDFEGYEFKIITQNMDNRNSDVMATEQNGATLNDLVYSRNLAVAEKFNITFVMEDTDFGTINNKIKTNVSAGDNPYDMYLSNAMAYSLASGGYLIAINNMPYIDLTQEWWDQNAISDMSVGGNIYMVTGDITPNGMMTSECMLFNKKLFDANSMEYPYQTAFDGKWTLDALNSMCSDLTMDLNGDGEIKSTDDLFSLTCWFDYSHAMLYGAGAVMVEKDADDIPYLKWDVESYVSIYDKIYNIIIGKQANFSTSDHVSSFNVFKDGRAYFCGIIFQKIDLFLRDMEDDFGVLPVPKYDEAQSRYITDVSGAGSMIVIPRSITADQIDMIGMVTEAMAAGAYDMITPSLYEVIVATKNVRDEESSQIVNMIIRNRVFDIAHMCYIPVTDFVDKLLKAKSTDVVSHFASIESASYKALDTLVTSYLENNK